RRVRSEGPLRRAEEPAVQEGFQVIGDLSMQRIVSTGAFAWLRAALAGIALATGLLVTLSGTATAQNDRVILKNGKDKQIRIKSEDLDGVWYAAPGGAGNTVIRWNEIDSLQYAGAASFP